MMRGDARGGAGRAGAGETPPVLDTDHLRRQTFDDPALEREVLALFREQLQALPDDFGDLPEGEMREALHRLKGAARGIGAFGLAETIEKLEADGAPQRLRQDAGACVEATLRAVQARLDPAAPRG